MDPPQKLSEPNAVAMIIDGKGIQLRIGSLHDEP
jgi:hypothetical protein